MKEKMEDMSGDGADNSCSVQTMDVFSICNLTGRCVE